VTCLSLGARFVWSVGFFSSFRLCRYLERSTFLGFSHSFTTLSLLLVSYRSFLMGVRSYGLRGGICTCGLYLSLPRFQPCTVPISQRCLSHLRPLNRAGMHDYIHPIHPEDEIRAAEGAYLMHRSYPEFTAKRFPLAKSAPKSRLTWHPKRRAQHRP